MAALFHVKNLKKREGVVGAAPLKKGGVCRKNSLKRRLSRLDSLTFIIIVKFKFPFKIKMTDEFVKSRIHQVFGVSCFVFGMK